MNDSENEPKNPIVPFTPIRLRFRRDGWTAERQIAFIEALAATGCFEEACRIVGMSDSSAYRLALRHPAFAAACDAAVDIGLARLEQASVARSTRGVPRPIFYKGEQVGEWRHYDERLTMFLLRNRRPARYGRWIEHGPPPDRDEPDPTMKLIRAMDFFEDDDDIEDGDGAGDASAPEPPEQP
jgi:hypothetical protein